MTVLIDTGPLVAYIDRDDPFHDRAVDLLDPIFRGEHGTPVSTDHVLEEGATFLRARSGHAPSSEAYLRLFWGPWEGHSRPMEFVMTDRATLRAACQLHVDRYEAGLSLTDCTLIAHARDHDALVATFDSGFEGHVGVLGL